MAANVGIIGTNESVHIIIGRWRERAAWHRAKMPLAPRIRIRGVRRSGGVAGVHAHVNRKYISEIHYLAEGMARANMRMKPAYNHQAKSLLHRKAFLVGDVICCSSRLPLLKEGRPTCTSMKSNAAISSAHFGEYDPSR